MIVYFSATGNSRYCAQFLAEQLNDSLLDAGNAIKQGEVLSFAREDRLIFVSPTYAWQLPHIYRDFLRRCSLPKHKPTYFVMTCGSEIGNAGAYLAKLCHQLELDYRGVLEVVMPENYIALFTAPAPEDAHKIVSAALPCLQGAAELILQNAFFPPHPIRLKDKIKSSIVNAVFYPFIVKSRPFFSTDDCIGCGKCVNLCPLNNIHLQNKKPVWGKNCTHCMACICGCPSKAIEYGNATQGKVRYQCIPYQSDK